MDTNLNNHVVSGETSTGFKFLIDRRKLNDFRYLAILSRVVKAAKNDVDAMSATVEMIDFILGEEQRNELAAHVAKTNGGYAPIDKVMSEFNEICSVKEVKNS